MDSFLASDSSIFFACFKNLKTTRFVLGWSIAVCGGYGTDDGEPARTSTRTTATTKGTTVGVGGCSNKALNFYNCLIRSYSTGASRATRALVWL